MASLRPSCLLLAAALAITITGGPAVATLGGQFTSPASRSLADPPVCTNIGTKGSPSLQCAPGMVAGSGLGLPSEQQLTEQNSHRAH